MESSVTSPTPTPFVSVSRQKNCNCCVQAKRRCDRRHPVCSRCLEKKTACIYTSRNNAHKKRTTPQHTRQEDKDSGDNVTEDDSHPGAFSFESAENSLFNSLDLEYSTSTSLDHAIPQVTACFGNPQHLHLLDDDMQLGNFMDLIGNNPLSTPDEWLNQGNDNEFQLIERPGTPVTKEVMRAYEKMDAYCASESAMMDVRNPDSIAFYIISRTKRYIDDMATTNATPFLHGRLYRAYVPQSILSCFANTALYANRTPANMSMTVRVLQNSIGELINAEAERGGVAALPPMDKLARTQALFLYQIIRLFDGDITLRAQGEKDMPLLVAWTAELCKIRDNLPEVAQLEYGTTRNLPPKDWDMVNAVTCMYEELKDPGCEDDDMGPWAYVHRWTLSKSLWEASSSFEFQRAWKAKPQFVISNFAFDTFLKNGRGEDVDDFAEMLLTVYLGIDEAKHFIATSKTISSP